MVFEIKHLLKFPMLAMASNLAMRNDPKMRKTKMFLTNIIFPNILCPKSMLSVLSPKDLPKTIALVGEYDRKWGLLCNLLWFAALILR